MKLRCDRKTFAEHLALVSPIAAGRHTRPILQHVLLEVEGSRLWLSASDLEITTRCEMELLEPGEDGRLCLPAARLLGIVREIRGESLDLSADGSVANLRTSSGQFHLSGDQADEFPEIPTGEGKHFAELPAAVFRELTQRTEFAASREPGRFAVNGILVELDDTLVRFVSTDGRRLSHASRTLEQGVGQAREILPLKGISHFLKSLGPETEVVGMCMSGRQILLRAGSVVLAATAVEAAFPDFRGAMGKTRPLQVEVDREEFFSSLRQAAVLSGDDTRSVHLRFQEGSITFSASMEGLGDARVEMPVDYTGAEVLLAFNPDYLLDFGKVDMPDQIRVHFGAEPGSSVMIEPDEGFQYVVMPVSAQ